MRTSIEYYNAELLESRFMYVALGIVDYKEEFKNQYGNTQILLASSPAYTQETAHHNCDGLPYPYY